MRVKQPDDKSGIMTMEVQGRYEDEIYEMCLMFRGAAAKYMGRCKDGDSPDTFVLEDLINGERKGDDFPVARGDDVLVAEMRASTTNRPRPVKVAYKPSFLDRLPPLEEEWMEALALDGNGRGDEEGHNAIDGAGDAGGGDEDAAADRQPGAAAVEGQGRTENGKERNSVWKKNYGKETCIKNRLKETDKEMERKD